MLAYAEEIAQQAGATVNFIHGDMRYFQLEVRQCYRAVRVALEYHIHGQRNYLGHMSWYFICAQHITSSGA